MARPKKSNERTVDSSDACPYCGKTMEINAKKTKYVCPNCNAEKIVE